MLFKATGRAAVAVNPALIIPHSLFSSAHHDNIVRPPVLFGVPGPLHPLRAELIMRWSNTPLAGVLKPSDDGPVNLMCL